MTDTKPTTLLSPAAAAPKPAAPTPPAPVAPKPVSRVCDTCNAFFGRKGHSQQAIDTAMRHGVDMTQGVCNAHPQPVPKHEHDWCREWQERLP